MKSRLAVSDAVYLKPLIFGLDKPDSPFELIEDIPAKNALKFSKRSDEIRSAFLSPIDYARHGGEYCIVPNICASSSTPTNTIQLFIKENKRNLERIAFDISYTSEVILANIILKEKYRNQFGHQNIQFIPMLPDINTMLEKTDAALLINPFPKDYSQQGIFILDLVEEWNDLTNLPYIYGFWVGREEELIGNEASALFEAKKEGLKLKEQIAIAIANQKKLSIKNVSEYLSAFNYDFNEKEEASLSEFMHYAYYHGIIGDVPEIRFFDLGTENLPLN